MVVVDGDLVEQLARGPAEAEVAEPDGLVRSRRGLWLAEDRQLPDHVAVGPGARHVAADAASWRLRVVFTALEKGR